MTREFIVNGTDRYLIRFDPQTNGTYKLFVLKCPPDPFRKGVSENHLNASGQICISAGNEPRTLDRARAIAQFWCSGWSTFIRTGGSFPNRAKRVDV
jgi:hypothetical protein